jgi:hypothetical protein
VLVIPDTLLSSCLPLPSSCSLGLFFTIARVYPSPSSRSHRWPPATRFFSFDQPRWQLREIKVSLNMSAPTTAGYVL